MKNTFKNDKKTQIFTFFHVLKKIITLEQHLIPTIHFMVVSVTLRCLTKSSRAMPCTTSEGAGGGRRSEVKLRASETIRVNFCFDAYLKDLTYKVIPVTRQVSEGSMSGLMSSLCIILRTRSFVGYAGPTSFDFNLDDFRVL